MKQPKSPTLDQHGWELESAEDRSAQTPGTFLIPSVEERTRLKCGQRVQLLFLFPVTALDGTHGIQCEKMWVTIDAVSDLTYQGTLDSRPVSSDAVNPGDMISFGPQHVASVLIPKTDPRHPRFKRR